jgi:outer membrane protein assembly factor BamB
MIGRESDIKMTKAVRRPLRINWSACARTTGSFLIRCCLCCLATGMSSAHAADWSTHRGNAQRTGNIDGQAGPSAPHVLWVHKSNDHFIASPVAREGVVYVSGLGAFNSASFFALATDPTAKERIRWAITTPNLKLPVVSAPSIAGGMMVFGDGMHQTDGGVLHGVEADTGRTLWEFAVPGQLVHLEGAATIAAGKVYIGGGNAGVLCIDPSRLNLEGKEVDLIAARAVLDIRRKELLAKYEADKKKDPDFAIPPSEDALPKPIPTKVWQQGKDQWHVDASVAVAGDRVLVASAFLDAERIGDRALVCLNASDGSTLWRTKLRANPWAGPTVAGDLILVGCSSIRFETKDIPKARGEVVAVALADGAIRWRREVVGGGAISPVAVAGNVAVCTGTDGKVRAFELASGEEKWTFDAKQPFFAGPAIVGNVVYVVDLHGKAHALNVTDGKKLWTLDTVADPAGGASGMVYGSPIVHGGRLYFATCNIEGDGARRQTAVFCIGDK